MVNMRKLVGEFASAAKESIRDFNRGYEAEESSFIKSFKFVAVPLGIIGMQSTRIGLLYAQSLGQVPENFPTSGVSDGLMTGALVLAAGYTYFLNSARRKGRDAFYKNTFE